MNWGEQEGRPGWRQPQEERCFPRITVWPSPECLLPGEESCSPPPSHRELYTLTSPSHPQGTPETCDSRTRAMASWLCQPQDFASQERTGTPQPPPNLAGHRQSRKQGTQQPCTAGCQLGVVMDPSLHQKKHPLSTSHLPTTSCFQPMNLLWSLPSHPPLRQTALPSLPTGGPLRGFSE